MLIRFKGGVRAIRPGLFGVGRSGVFKKFRFGVFFTVFQFSEAKSVQNVYTTIVRLST